MEKKYIYASFTRSLDKDHLQKNCIHLLGSIFYSNKFDTSKLKVSENDTVFILRFFLDFNTDYYSIECLVNSDKLVVYRINLLYFIYGHNHPNSLVEDKLTKESFKDKNNFILGLLGAYDLNSPDNYNNYINNIRFKLNKILFVFEDIDWYSIKYIFLLADIIISSGSITKRHILSTTQFNLNKNLIFLGYNEESVYNSYIYLNNLKKDKACLSASEGDNLQGVSTGRLGVLNNFSASDNIKISNTLSESKIKEYIKYKLNTILTSIQENITNLEKDIKDKLANIEYLENTILNKKIEIKKVNKKVSNSKRIQSFEKKIAEVKIYLENQNNKIKELNYKKSVALKNIELIETMTLDSLKEFYLKFFHRFKVSDDIETFNSYIENNSILRKKNYKSLRNISLKQSDIPKGGRVFSTFKNNPNIGLSKKEAYFSSGAGVPATHNSFSFFKNPLPIKSKCFGLLNKFNTAPVAEAGMLVKIKKAFLFTFILDSLNIDIPDDASHTVKFAFGVFLLSLVCLLNFINVVGYLTSIYLVNKYNIEEKFPKLKKVIRYYEKSSLFFVVLEGITCAFFLLCIIIFSLIEIGLPFFK